jgi:REP-associated tyrosine transposase
MWIDGRFSKKCKRYNTLGHAHELTFSCYRNRSFLTRAITCDWLLEAIQKARDKHEFSLWAYVFMPNHVHLVICPRYESYSISSILQTIKQPVSFKAIRYLKKEKPDGLTQLATGHNSQPYCFWQKGGGYDRNISSVDTLLSTVRYIHNNPVRKGLVKTPDDWYYSSSAGWSSVRDEPLAIDKDDWPVT